VALHRRIVRIRVEPDLEIETIPDGSKICIELIYAIGKASLGALSVGVK
jgi:hypothetical protein